MIVIETNSMQFPTPEWTKQDNEIVVTVKRPTKNTNILAGRHISARRNGPQFPFLCYKWNPSMTDPKWRDIPRDNIAMADWKRWDDWYRSYNPKHKDPSSGTCAVYSVIEYFQPKEIGLIGFDFVLDNNTDWLHDARAERESIEALVSIVDLRDRTVAVKEAI